ncbi:hypothetical protein E2C01_097845 [Portunus trituberculatus]|uniref:Uncharacterized protein n=1 Tax=Portunus trituberculatus TaxID=210409 RepID=A0A5B7JZP3_PORTR|nr:hypothetical protein [Portunus trituberculatus]
MGWEAGVVGQGDCGRREEGGQEGRPRRESESEPSKEVGGQLAEGGTGQLSVMSRGRRRSGHAHTIWRWAWPRLERAGLAGHGGMDGAGAGEGTVE